MLVSNHIDRFLALAQPVGKVIVKRGQARTGINQEKRDIAFLKGHFALLAHFTFDGIVKRLFQTSSIDNVESHMAKTRLAITAITRDARLVIDQRQLLADQTVKQGRLPDIGATDNGYFQRHLTFRLIVIKRRCAPRGSLPRSGARAYQAKDRIFCEKLRSTCQRYAIRSASAARK